MESWFEISNCPRSIFIGSAESKSVKSFNAIDAIAKTG